MITETEARELLGKAAATIDVPPGAPIEALAGGGRRRWMIPAVAAAAVAVVVVVAFAVLPDDTNGSRPPVTGPTTPRVAEPGADGRIPWVFAYPGESAARMLSALGLVVTVEPSNTCDYPGRAVRTKPGAGTRFQPGDAVVLIVTGPGPLLGCKADELAATAWSLLDFANGRGPAPAFASEVTVYVNDAENELSGDEAAELQSWAPDSALGLLAAATRPPVSTGASEFEPGIGVHSDDGTQFVCGGFGLPADLATRRSTWFSIGDASASMGLRLPSGCVFANVFRTDGRIDAIVVRTWGELYPVVEQVPEPDPDPDGIGAAFLEFARGEREVLPIDTPVALYLGNEYQKTISAADAQDPESWNVCAPYAERSCPMSAVATLRAFEGRPAVTDFLPDGCVDTIADAPTETGGPNMVALGVPEPQTCADDFVVQIWSNDVGQITAVNLLFGSP